MDPRKTRQIIDKPVTIQDLVVVAKMSGKSPTGEFGLPNTVNTDDQLNRLYATIHQLTFNASLKHQQSNCDHRGQLLPGKENTITRVVTNEFAFYTKTPLSMADFNSLQQRIVDLAKNQPQNLHLVLSSFAVRTPDNKIMNVVAHIECGPKPKVNFTVKNNPSSIDPVYTERVYNTIKTLPNIDISHGDCVDHLGVKIDGKIQPFSFNNVFECTTAGGAKFHSCVEICLDHAYGVAKKRLNQKLDNPLLYHHPNHEGLLPTQCSHIVTSNIIYLDNSGKIGTVTHADPQCSPSNPKAGAHIVEKHAISNPPFGTPLNVIVTNPTICSQLPAYEMKKVNDYNHKLLNAPGVARSPVNYYPNANANLNYRNGYPNYGNAYPNYGNAYPNYGNAYPNYGNAYPNYGNAYTNYGNVNLNVANSWLHYGNVNRNDVKADCPIFAASPPILPFYGMMKPHPAALNNNVASNDKAFEKMLDNFAKMKINPLSPTLRLSKLFR